MPGRSSLHPDVTSKETREIKPRKNSDTEIEILTEGMECPNCHFASLRREGFEIICPVCGCGYRPCT